MPSISKHKPVYLLVIFMAGLTGLVYQILWIREFTLLFGVHIYSLSTVVATFMGGLAFGSYLFGKIADRYPTKCGLIFFLIQALLGVFAMVFGVLLGWLSDLFVFSSRTFDLSIHAVNFIRPLFAAILLLFPTTLMGGVIPLASRLFVSNTGETGKKVSMIYFVNNAGAVVGSLMAGFVLVAAFGMQTTFRIAAMINFVIGVIGLIFYFTGRNRKVDPVPSATDFAASDRTIPVSVRQMKIALWVFGIEGFTTLAYQVLWTRLMISFSFEKTIYFTTIIITSFILGLALGGLFFYYIESRIRNLFRFLGTIEVLAGLSSLALFILFNRMAPAMVASRPELSGWWALAFREYAFVMALLLIPTFFTGMTFPLITKMYTRKLSHVGSRVGIAGMLDTAGAIAGSLLAAFVMLPLLGIYMSFMLVVVINIIIGLVVYHQSLRGQYGLMIKMAIPLVLVVMVMIFPPAAYQRLQDQFHPDDKIVFRREGVAATVQVNSEPSGHLALVINGAKTAFTNDDDLRVHKMLAYLPHVINRDAESAYVIGFGMGVTAATLAELSLERIKVADICPELLETAQFFIPYNRDIVSNPKFTFMAEDGRSYLLRTAEKFDLITSNAVHARLNANLYTREFYELTAQRLNPGGIMAQWVPTNWLTADEFRALIAAFTDVFDYSRLWFINKEHVILTGATRPNSIIYSNIEDIYRNSGHRHDLSGVGISSPQEFAARLLLSHDDLRDFADGPLSNTDDLPIVEFSRETNLQPNLTILEAFSQIQPDFKNEFIFPDYPTEMPENNILEVIKAENRLFRSYLQDNVNNHGRNESQTR